MRIVEKLKSMVYEFWVLARHRHERVKFEIRLNMSEGVIKIKVRSMARNIGHLKNMHWHRSMSRLRLRNQAELSCTRSSLILNEHMFSNWLLYQILDCVLTARKIE